jgi:hypothetical protein
MEQIENQDLKPHFIRYTVYFEFDEDYKDNEKVKTLITSEFIDEQPYKARQKAIEHYKKICRILELAQEKGIISHTLNASGLTEHKEAGGKIWFQDIYYDTGGTALTWDNGYGIEESLSCEYDYYIEHGFEIPETKEIIDIRGNKRKIMPFNLKLE